MTYKPFVLNKFVKIFHLKEIYNMNFICEDILNEKCVYNPQQNKIIYQEFEMITPYKSTLIKKMRDKYNKLYNKVYEQMKYYDNHKLQLIQLYIEYKQINLEYYNELIIKLSQKQREKIENTFIDFAFNEILEKYHICNDSIYKCEEKFSNV